MTLPDSVVRVAWEAYAKARYNLEGTKPTELERDGLEAAINAALPALCQYIRAFAGRESVLISVEMLQSFSQSEAHKLRKRVAELECKLAGYVEERSWFQSGWVVVPEGKNPRIWHKLPYRRFVSPWERCERGLS